MYGRKLVVVAALMIIAAVLFSACGGHKRTLTSLQGENGPQQRVQSVADALANLDALTAPEGVKPEVFAQLKDALRAALRAKGTSKIVSTPPTGEANRVNDLAISDNGDGTYSLTWHYRNLGDYNQDGVVGVSDITPLAVHYGEAWAAGEEDSIAAVVDGSGNNKVDIADVTPIAMNFAIQVDHYTIEASDVIDSGWMPFAMCPPPAADNLSRLSVPYNLGATPAYEYWRVAPVDASGTQGDYSNVAQVTYAPLLPPADVAASDGTLADRIRITWDKSLDATGYKIYRDTQDSLLVTLGDVDTWDDRGVSDYASHTYWVQAINAVIESELSAPDVGYLAQAPYIADIAPVSGEPGEDITFFATVSGSNPMTYEWDFGGGATPDTSNGVSPQVVLSDTAGEYNASLNVFNAYASDSYAFTLTIAEADTTSPVISMITPVDGTDFTLGYGRTTFTVSSSDNVGVAMVEFYINGSLYYTDYSAPYSAPDYTFTSGDVGQVEFMAKAFDAAGNNAADTNTVIVYPGIVFDLNTWPEEEFYNNDDRQPYLYFVPQDPLIRRNPLGQRDMSTPPAFVPDDAAAYNDMVKAAGDEFLIVYGETGPPPTPDSPLVYYSYDLVPPPDIASADGQVPISSRQPHLLAGIASVVDGAPGSSIDVSFGLFSTYGTYLGGVTRIRSSMQITRSAPIRSLDGDFGVRPWGPAGDSATPNFTDKVASISSADVVVFSFYNLWLRHDDTDLPPGWQGTHVILTDFISGVPLPDLKMRNGIIGSAFQGARCRMTLDISQTTGIWLQTLDQEIPDGEYTVTIDTPGTGGFTYPDNLVITP